MATLPSNSGYVTLLDVARGMNPDGSAAVVAELLSQKNEILMDAQWTEGNLPTGHRITMETALPTTIFRDYYQGIPESKSTLTQVDEVCSQIAARSSVDEDIANLNGNIAKFRLQRAGRFIESMNQTFSKNLFYGNQLTNRGAFPGLALRYSSSTAGNGQNIIKGGGSSNANNSIWLVGWGPGKVQCIYPKGSVGGLQHRDKGLQDAFDASNNRFTAYIDEFKWNCGLAVEDWRYAVRIANIDQATLLGDSAGTTVKLIEYMIKAMARIPDKSGIKLSFYVNRTIAEMLMIQAMNKSTNALSLVEGANQFTTRFLGVPIRTTDALLSTESNVV